MDEKSLSMFKQYGNWLYLIFGLNVSEIEKTKTKHCQMSNNSITKIIEKNLSQYDKKLFLIVRSLTELGSPLF